MAKLVIEVDTEAKMAAVVTVDGVQVDLPDDFNLQIHNGRAFGSAHFWEPANRHRYIRGGEGFNPNTPISEKDLKSIAFIQARQASASELLKRIPCIEQWMIEVQPRRELPPEKN